jgi:2'-5' RNA ligase
MAKYVLMEQYHITVRVPSDLPEATTDALRSVLDGRRFRFRFRRTIRTAFRREPALRPAQVNLSR